jgi:hypothetical protein
VFSVSADLFCTEIHRYAQGKIGRPLAKAKWEE